MKAILTLLAVGVLSACQPNTKSVEHVNASLDTKQSSVEQSQQSETERLNQWFAVKYEEELQMSPLMLTFLGRKEKYDQIDDMSEAAEKKS